MIRLKNKASGAHIGSLTEEQLQYLIDELEEEDKEDQDYWLNRAQIAIFKAAGADPRLIAILESALGENEDMEVIWERT